MTTQITLQASEAALLVGGASLSTAALAGEFGPLPDWAKAGCVFVLAVAGYLGYSAYTSPAAKPATP